MSITKGSIKCPHCKRGKVVVKKGTDAIVSVRCPECRQFADYDVEKMEAVKGRAIRNAS